MIPAIAAAAVRGFVGATATFDRATNVYARSTEKTEQIISSIAKYSPQVQFGQAQAEIIKIKADLASDKIGGKEFKNYLVQSAKTDASLQQLYTYFYKWSSQILTVLNKILESIAERVLPLVKAIDDWLGDWWDAFLKTIKEFADTFRLFIGEFAASWLIKQANMHEAEKARNKPFAIVPDLVNFFTTYVNAPQITPIAPGVF